MHIFKMILIASGLLFAETVNQYSAMIEVKSGKKNGNSWDLFGNNPDIMLVVEGSHYYNMSCRDKYRCKISFTSQKENWYIEIYDKDVRVNDLIGNGKCHAGSKCTLGQAVIEIRK